MLTLLLGICYLGGVCELDAEECKRNYAKESHDYVLAADAYDACDADLHLSPLPDAPALALLPAPAWRALWAAVVTGSGSEGETWPVPAAPPPRPRLYLRYAVLQV